MTRRTGVLIVGIVAILLDILVTRVMVIAMGLDAHEDANLINKVFFGVLTVFVILMIWKTSMTFRIGCLKIENGRGFIREMIEAVIVSAVFIVGMLIFRQYLNAHDPVAAARPKFGLYLWIHGRWFYPISVVAQEFFIKGVMQENFRSLKTPENTHLTIWINGIFFMILHMNYPVYYLICAGLLCIITGYLYERDKNIWGSTLIHFVVGFMPRALGLK